MNTGIHEYAYKVQEVVKQSAHHLSYESLKQQLDEHYERDYRTKTIWI